MIHSASDCKAQTACKMLEIGIFTEQEREKGELRHGGRGPSSPGCLTELRTVLTKMLSPERQTRLSGAFKHEAPSPGPEVAPARRPASLPGFGAGCLAV